ncbi:MAG: LuxR family transcriptional regulator [Coriobacteriales bacterium]|jgi:DNA-binding CsgD family transcriptional regulator|nr:LuxR family transcriptional regulator [Coriobacteriales bacterium]
MFPPEGQTAAVLSMYQFSTVAIGSSMLVAALFWKKVTGLIDNRAVVISFGLFAALATGLLGFSAQLGGTTLFIICAICTGLGTSFLCLKVGRVYGSVSLGDSLTAGGVSLFLAALLYFVGVGIPVEGRIFYIAALPLVSALLLVLKSTDLLECFEGGALGSTESALEGFEAQGISPTPRKLIVRLALASAVIALTAGIGKGLSSRIVLNEEFALQGAKVVFAIGVIAILIIVIINRQSIRKGAYQIYAGLMVLGIAMLLASAFGFPLTYLNLGKEALWLVLSCFMAYVAFRHELSPVWVFGVGQAAYFFSSTAGWMLGSALSPYYSIDPLQTTFGIVMAFVIVVVLVYVFNGEHLSRITDLSTSALPVEVVAEEDSLTKPGLTISGDYELSQREMEVMEMFAQGRSANWIADTLLVSTSTVRSHIRAVYVKLGVHSRQELLDVLGNEGKA